MISKELNSFVFKSLTSFIDYCRGNSDTFMKDSIRGNKDRVEILSALVFAENIVSNQSSNAELLFEQRTRELLWPECAYSPTDENISYWGTVPTAFAIIALSKELSNNPNNKLLDELIKSCDALYQLEQNGYFRKAGVNRSDVHNTNLLAGYALIVASQLLPNGSVRARMYRESAQRATLKCLMHQSFSGYFPYHQRTIACPILYQAMVTTILKLLLLHFPDPLLKKSYEMGVNALKKFYSRSGKINWEIANHHDKRGATWAYSFTLSALPPNDPLEVPIQKHFETMQSTFFQGVEGDPSTKDDIFYTSWILFGLSWSATSSPDANIPSQFIRTTIRWYLLKFHFILGTFSYLFAYAKNKYLNFLFKSGALENRKWGV